MKYQYECLSEIGNVRSANEDSFGVADTPNGMLFVVCDGMGGHVGGATASKLAVNSIIEFFKMRTHDDLYLAIDEAFQFANEQVFAHTLAEPQLKGMGTTAALLIIKGEECFIGHVGDSRIYLKTADRLHRITKDHSYVQGLVDNHVITDEEAERHPKKNQILKALGHSADVKGTVCKSPLKVQAGDVFMLCSDGLNGMITDSIIEKKIDSKNLQESKRDLYQTALANGGHDNITLILIGISESRHYGKSVFQSFNPKPPADVTVYERSTQALPGDIQPLSNKGGLFTKKSHFIISGLVVVCLFLPAGYFLYEYFRSDKEISLDKGEKKKSKEENSIKKYTKAELEEKTYKELQDMADKAILIDTYSVDTNDFLTTKEKFEVKVSVKDGKLIKVAKIVTEVKNEVTGIIKKSDGTKLEKTFQAKKNETLKSFLQRLNESLKIKKIDCKGLSTNSLKTSNKNKFKGAELSKFLKDTIPRAMPLEYTCN